MNNAQKKLAALNAKKAKRAQSKYGKSHSAKVGYASKANQSRNRDMLRSQATGTSDSLVKTVRVDFDNRENMLSLVWRISAGNCNYDRGMCELLEYVTHMDGWDRALALGLYRELQSHGIGCFSKLDEQQVSLDDSPYEPTIQTKFNVKTDSYNSPANGTGTRTVESDYMEAQLARKEVRKVINLVGIDNAQAYLETIASLRYALS